MTTEERKEILRRSLKVERERKELTASLLEVNERNFTDIQEKICATKKALEAHDYLISLYSTELEKEGAK